MNTIIRNGLVIDPASGRNRVEDIYFSDGRITTANSFAESEATIVPADGKLVCPGFIDIHMHEDPVDAQGKIEVDEATSIFACMLRMGVTTAIGGNCGESKYHPADYLDLADRYGAPVHVGMLAAHEYFRTRSGCTDRYGAASPAQKAQMAQEMTSCVERGCFGVSYGVRYVPGMDASEMMETAAGAAALGGFIAAHIRDDAKAVFSALKEYLDVAEALHMPAQVSHIGSMAGFGQMQEFLRQIDRYREAGNDVTCDCYPYEAYSTSIGSACYDDGWLERYDCGYDVLEIAEGKYQGQRCTEEIFREVRTEHPEYKTICHVMDGKDVNIAFSHPGVMLASDGTLNHGHGHPRAAGAFPRFLSRYVKNGIVSLERAVEMMTLMPAERLGLENKGRLTPGSDADIVIIDLNTLEDTATFAQPLCTPKGIDMVWVGGQLACQEGKILLSRAGKSVRKVN